MTEHARRAQVFAERLTEIGVDVVYPGMSDHPDHGLFRAIGRPEYGFGGLLTIDAGSRLRAEALMDDLQNQEGFCGEPGYFDVDVVFCEFYIK